MTVKHRIVSTLLRLYPAAWRSEYGAELADMLLARPLTGQVIINVAWNGLWQRTRVAELSTLLGFTMLVLVLAGFSWNILAPAPYGQDTLALQHALVRRDSSALVFNGQDVMVLLQLPVRSEFYVLVLVAWGCWIRLRYGGQISQSGMAAVKLSFVAGLPVMLAGLLMLSGVLGVAVLGPGENPTTFENHGFTYTYYNEQPHPPAALGVLLAPVMALAQSWIWGAVGGLLGRALSRVRRVAVANLT